MAEAESSPTRSISQIRQRSALAQNALPLLASLSFHAAILLVGLLTYQSVKVLLRGQVQTVVGDTPLVSPPVNLGINDGFRGDQNRPDLDPRNNEPADASAIGWNNRGGADRRTFEPSDAADPQINPSLDTLIGIGPRPGNASHSGDLGEGGPAAPYGIPRRRGGANIFTLGAAGAKRPHSIAYLCDASGSMLPRFDTLKRELAKAVEALQPVQSFSIQFFTDNRAISLGPSLVMATPQNKLHAMSFLDQVAPRGSTDPLPSLEIAFKQKPQLIFLLTDGDFPNNQAVLSRIRQLNKDHRVRINTIAFVGEGDSDNDFIALLRQIAQENGGTYRHVTEDQLH